MERFDKFFDLLLKLEGGYSDNAADKGGKTKYGITNNTLKSYNLITNSKISIDSLSKDQAKKIYKRLFYDCVNHYTEEQVHYLLFDLCVNSGYATYLRCSMACDEDLEKIYKWRKDFYESIVKKDETQKVFLKGWLNRLSLIKKNFDKKDPL